MPNNACDHSAARTMDYHISDAAPDVRRFVYCHTMMEHGMGVVLSLLTRIGVGLHGPTLWNGLESAEVAFTNIVQHVHSSPRGRMGRGCVSCVLARSPITSVSASRLKPIPRSLAVTTHDEPALDNRSHVTKKPHSEAKFRST